MSTKCGGKPYLSNTVKRYACSTRVESLLLIKRQNDAFAPRDVMLVKRSWTADRDVYMLRPGTVHACARWRQFDNRDVTSL